MILWIDAQLPPALAAWIQEELGVEAYSVRRLGLRDATDHEIHTAARAAGAAVMTKDADFVRLLEKHGAPPAVLLVTCGNSSNARMRGLLSTALVPALDQIAAGTALVKIDFPEAGPRP